MAPISTDVPARLDRLPWSRWHWRVVIALGITYIIVVGGHPSLTDNWQRISDEVIPRFANG